MRGYPGERADRRRRGPVRRADARGGAFGPGQRVVEGGRLNGSAVVADARSDAVDFLLMLQAFEDYLLVPR